jgi:hypothetical protein
MRYADRRDGRAGDVFVVVLAAFTIVAPWYNGAELHPYAAVVAQLIGTWIGAIALWALARPRSLEAECINALLGVALAGAPFLVRSVPIEGLECWLAGGAVVVLSVTAVKDLTRRAN